MRTQGHRRICRGRGAWSSHALYLHKAVAAVPREIIKGTFSGFELGECSGFDCQFKHGMARAAFSERICFVAGNPRVVSRTGGAGGHLLCSALAL